MALFNAGDQVKLVGTVKESVADKGGSSRVSVLFATLETPGKPPVEYWANEADLVADPPEAAATTEAAPGKTAASHGAASKHA